MSPINYTIKLINQSRGSNVFLFQESPKSDNGPSGGVQSVVIEAINLQRGSRAHLLVSNELYAIFGTAINEGYGSSIATRDSRPVELGPNGSVVAVSNKSGEFGFDNEAAAGKRCTTVGGFQFNADETVPRNGDHYIGLGIKSPMNRQIIPVAAYVAEPNKTTTIFPKSAYYIAMGGDFRPGQLVDRNMIQSHVKIDFEKLGRPDVDVVINGDGTLTVGRGDW